MSSVAGGGNFTPGTFMVTADLQHWNNYYNKDQNDKYTNNKHSRLYVAIFDLGDVDVPLYMGRGFGHEIFLTKEMAKNAILITFLPLKKALDFDRRYNSKLPGSKKELLHIYNLAHQIN